MKIEIRSDSVKLSGYVNAVERRSAVLPQRVCRAAPGDFVEVIKAGTFGASLAAKPEVRLMFNHAETIGSTGNELELREDNIGLHAEATITDADVISAARAHKLTGWSFGFTNPKDDWSEPDAEGIYTRSISGLDLIEVSILTKRPAYPATSVEVRDGEATEYEYRHCDDDNDIEDLTDQEQETQSEPAPEKVASTTSIRQAELDLIKIGGI